MRRRLHGKTYLEVVSPAGNPNTVASAEASRGVNRKGTEMPLPVWHGIARELVPWTAHRLDDPSHSLARLKLIAINPNRFADDKKARAVIPPRTRVFSEPDIVMQ